MISIERIRILAAARFRDLHMERIPKRVWLGSGAALALFGGVAAAGAASLATHDAGGAPELAPRTARLLQIETAPVPPLTAPPPVASDERLAVLAAPPADLGDLDPDLQRSAGYAALAASMKRYDAQLAREIATSSVDARPLPTALSIDVPERPEPLLLRRASAESAPPAHEDDVAASGDTGRSTGDDDD